MSCRIHGSGLQNWWDKYSSVRVCLFAVVVVFNRHLNIVSLWPYRSSQTTEPDYIERQVYFVSKHLLSLRMTKYMQTAINESLHLQDPEYFYQKIEESENLELDKWKIEKQRSISLPNWEKKKKKKLKATRRMGIQVCRDINFCVRNVQLEWKIHSGNVKEAKPLTPICLN